jgi:hypothetical protein
MNKNFDDQIKPDAFMDAVYNHIHGNVMKFGRQMISVSPEKGTPGFIYTIGNHLKGLPELLLIGPCDAAASNLLTSVAMGLEDQNTPFLHGSFLKVDGFKHKMQIWNCGLKAKLLYTVQATQYYLSRELDTNYKVQQVVVADPKGRWPDDPKCSKKYRVPLLLPVEGVQ